VIYINDVNTNFYFGCN